jgi:predicted TIM-barrel fold metal-dependent hydrolase
VIVDAHHHLWDLKRFPYAWLSKDAPPRPFGDHAGIKRNFLPEDYRRATSDLGIERTVHVEASPGAVDPSAESKWLSEITRASGIPNASIAHLDPARPDAAVALDAIRAIPGVRGVRTGIAWRANSSWRFADRGGVSRSAQFRAGITEVAKRDLVLEVILLPEQLVEIAEIAAANPEMPVVANHLATLQPEIPGNLVAWKDGIRAFAERPNAYVKLSGLWTIARDWDKEQLDGPIRYAVNAFGADRCMWGSNLPVEGLMCTAARQLETLEAILSDRSAYERSAIFGDSATRLYSLEAAR